MSQSRCPSCGKAYRADLFVCHGCVADARTHLDEAAAHLRIVDSVRARRGSNWAGDRGGHAAETPLPFDPRVSIVLTPVANNLTTWARVVSSELGGIPPRGLAAICAWMRSQLLAIAGQPWATDALKDFADDAKALARLVDVPGDRWALGICSVPLEDDDGRECPQVLSCEAGAATHRCPRCHTEHDVAARRRTMLEAVPDTLVTIREASVILLVADRDLRALVRHLGLVPDAIVPIVDTAGRIQQSDAYRLGPLREGVDLLHDDDDTRRAIARLKRGA